MVGDPNAALLSSLTLFLISRSHCTTCSMGLPMQKGVVWCEHEGGYALTCASVSVVETQCEARMVLAPVIRDSVVWVVLLRVGRARAVRAWVSSVAPQQQLPIVGYMQGYAIVGVGQQVGQHAATQPCRMDVQDTHERVKSNVLVCVAWYSDSV